MNDRVSRFSAAVKSATFVNDTIIVRAWSYKHPDNVISELVEIIICPSYPDFDNWKKKKLIDSKLLSSIQI